MPDQLDSVSVSLVNLFPYLHNVSALPSRYTPLYFVTDYYDLKGHYAWLLEHISCISAHNYFRSDAQLFGKSLVGRTRADCRGCSQSTSAPVRVDDGPSKSDGKIWRFFDKRRSADDETAECDGKKSSRSCTIQTWKQRIQLD